MIRFEIPGEAKGKGRTRTSPLYNKKTGEPIKSKKTGRQIINEVTPKETVMYENRVMTCFQNAGCEKINGDIPLLANVTAYTAIPKSASKKTRQAMLLGAILPTKKPDADNIQKIIFDSLNGIAYDDDKQIVQVWYRKYYSENPRVDVEIKPVELPNLV